MTIDEELRRAADDLRRDLRTTNPPPLDRSADQRLATSGGRFVLVMASLLVFAVGGFVLVSNNRAANNENTVADEQDVEEPVQPDQTEDETTVATDTDLVTPQPAEVAAVDPATGVALAKVETPVLPGSAVLPIPAGAPTWNADGSLLLLYEVGIEDGGHALYDGRSLDRIRSLDILPVDIEQVWWDPTEPNRLYYVTGNELLAHDVMTDQVVVAHRFAGCSVVDGANTPRPIDSSGRRFGSLCRTGNSAEFVAVDLSTNTEVRRPADQGAVGPVPLADGSGYVTASINGTVVVYDNDLEPTGVSFTVGTDQFALIETADGRQLFVTTVFSEPAEAIGSVVGFDLSTGEPVVAIGEATGYPYPPSGTRLAASVAGGGQVVVSIVGSVVDDGVVDDGGVDTNDQASLDGIDGLDGKVFLVDFNSAEPTVTQIASHGAGIDLAGINAYWTAPHPGLHPDGATVAFAGGLVDGQITTFVAGPTVEGTP